MKYLGSGSFTKAYQNEAGNVILHSVDPTRKVLADKELENKHFPRIHHIKTMDDCEVYGMEFLHVLGDNNNFKYMNARSKKFWERFHWKDLDGYKNILHFIKSEMNDFPQEQKAFLEALRCFWGSGINLAIEFYEMNVAVNKDTGDLIFFDMFIDNDALNGLSY